jgi:osmotically-inducible protein OsmY
MAMRTMMLAAVLALPAGCSSAPPVKAFGMPEAQTSAELTPPEQALRDRVRRMLVERMGDSAGAIRVRVQGTNLWLVGRAPDRWNRDLAREIAHDVPGVTRVDISGLAVN